MTDRKVDFPSNPIRVDTFSHQKLNLSKILFFKVNKKKVLREEINFTETQSSMFLLKKNRRTKLIAFTMRLQLKVTWTLKPTIIKFICLPMSTVNWASVTHYKSSLYFLEDQEPRCKVMQEGLNKMKRSQIWYSQAV